MMACQSVYIFLCHRDSSNFNFPEPAKSGDTLDWTFRLCELCSCVMAWRLSGSLYTAHDVTARSCKVVYSVYRLVKCLYVAVRISAGVRAT